MKAVRVINEVFLHYISVQQLFISGNAMHDCLNYIIAENKPGSLQCTRCESLQWCRCDSLFVTLDFKFDIKLATVIFFLKKYIYGIRHIISWDTGVTNLLVPKPLTCLHKEKFISMIIFPSLQLPCQKSVAAGIWWFI